MLQLTAGTKFGPVGPGLPFAHSTGFPVPPLSTAGSVVVETAPVTVEVLNALGTTNASVKPIIVSNAARSGSLRFI
jgi:hypothetical protein